MLREVSAQCRLADELGYESVLTEHHFHIEGFEVPTTLCCSISYRHADQAHSRRPARHRAPRLQPIRVAEDIAMLDHMTGGACAGFARATNAGSTSWRSRRGIHGALRTSDEIDAANREAFEECFAIIKKCWNEEIFPSGRSGRSRRADVPAARDHRQMGQGRRGW
jgi:alkanesulfonate monooxygenase SsuD/methylene tetrahydromethanopterin reductase-like flavin-dependent oxidoreductase (luciferase family)